MDDEGLPLVPPLPLSQPAVQALNDIPDAPPSSKSTGGDIDMEESDMVINVNSATASSSSSSLETNENQDDDAGGEPPSVGGAPPPSPTPAPTVKTPGPTPPIVDARPNIRALTDVLLLPPDGQSSSHDEDTAAPTLTSR